MRSNVTLGLIFIFLVYGSYFCCQSNLLAPSRSKELDATKQASHLLQSEA